MSQKRRTCTYFCIGTIYVHINDTLLFDPIWNTIFYIMIIRVTWRVSYKQQELLALRGHLGSSPVLGGVCVDHLFVFLCCVVLFVLFVFVLCLMCPTLPGSLDCSFLIKKINFWRKKQKIVKYKLHNTAWEIKTIKTICTFPKLILK